jgi:glutathione S-transferase
VTNAVPILYWYPGTCARVPLVALEEAGEEFEIRVATHEIRAGAEYRKLNPKGKVPLLIHDGHLITENPAIQFHLARTYPQQRLLPLGDPWVELDVLSTMSWFAAGVHPAITRLRMPQHFCVEPSGHESLRAIARSQLEDAFGILERRLAEREWLYDQWSLVDVYLLRLWFRATGSGMDGRLFPRCGEHAQRVESRPSVARALDREERELERLVATFGPQIAPHAFQAGRAPDLG